jgi:peptidase M28-like protein/PDZ domain-containing protein
MPRLSRRGGSVVAALFAGALAACHSPAAVRPGRAETTPLADRDIAYLASEQLEGRATGTPGNDSAAAYIARRFREMGLPTVTVQPFIARSVALAHAGLPSELKAQNVFAVLPGRDAKLRGEYVVLGAHYDHLGRSTFGALDPELPNAIHNGADDNASGVATVLELARRLAAHPPKRSVIFATFSGEELGLLGSAYFTDHLPVALDSVQAMLNFDMVGRLRDDQLLIYGVETATELRALVDSANAATNLRVTATGDGFGASDQSSFYAKGLPVLHFFTNVHDDYHKATDDAEKINIPGLLQVATLAERVTRGVADRPGRLTFVRAVAAAPTTSSREGSSVYLGSIPDMGGTGVTGLRLSGVRAGSPADVAGLKSGDIVVELGGAPVKDLYSYTDALYAHKPGDTITVVVMRGTERVSVQVTLGKRS